MDNRNSEDSDSSDEDYVPDEPLVTSQQGLSPEEEIAPIFTEKKKSQSDALWADFLKDIPASSRPVKTVADTGVVKVEKSIPTGQLKEQPSAKVKVTQVFDFAGEEVQVTKEVDADSAMAKKEKKKEETTPSNAGVKRLSSGGLGGILQQLSKKPKMTVLDKSHMDWNKFRTENKLEDSLDQFRRSKGSYVERQAFLERSDLREFEQEKNLRLGSRSK